MDKKVLIIQDISCFGSCSLSVANSVLNAFGFETCMLPSAIFSTHTGFKNFEVLDFTEKMDDFVNHYINEKIKFDCILIGYIYNTKQQDIIVKAINNLLNEGGIVVLDPAMADNGKLYKGLGMEHVIMMRNLLKYSDFVIPNITEAELLTKTCDDYRLTANSLIELGCKNVIMTSVIMDNLIANYCVSKNYEKTICQERLDKSYHGVGDLFTAAFVGYYLNSLDINLSVTYAQEYIYKAILATSDDKDHGYGVKFEGLLKEFSNKLN